MKLQLSPKRPRPASALLRQLLMGCAAALYTLPTACASTQGRVRELARAELACGDDALRVQSLGELSLLRPQLSLRVYHAEGCEQERTYYCRASSDDGDGQARAGCAATLRALGVAPQHEAAVARALHVRRTTSRARCPGSEERLVQESATLYRFEACDGDALVHCRASGCQVIGY